MQITKANKLTETKYLHLLDVAKTLREVYLRMSKLEHFRVYTEARKGGLRSKICLYSSKIKPIHITKLNEMVKTLYPHLDIIVKQPTKKYLWSSNDVCIFIKVK